MAIFSHMDERRRIQRKKPSPQRQDASGKSFIDYSLERPFGDWADAEIFKNLKTALSLQPMDLEITFPTIQPIPNSNLGQLNPRLLN